MCNTMKYKENSNILKYWIPRILLNLTEMGPVDRNNFSKILPYFGGSAIRKNFMRLLTLNRRAAPRVDSTSERPGANRAPGPGRCTRVAVARAGVAG